MNLKTNVVVKDSNARAVYETILNSSKNAPSKSGTRKERLAAFSKKINDSNKQFQKQNTMTTFEKFFKDNPEQKEIYEKEYKNFLLSEFMLEKTQKENLSIKKLDRQ